MNSALNFWGSTRKLINSFDVCSGNSESHIPEMIYNNIRPLIGNEICLTRGSDYRILFSAMGLNSYEHNTNFEIFLHLT